MRQALLCADPEIVLAMAESIIGQGLLGRAEVAHLLGRLAERLDVSDSGSETLVRERLQRLGIKLRPQVAIQGVGRR